MRLSPIPVSDGVSISSRLFFIPVAETSMSIEMNNLFSVRDTARFETETLFFMIVWASAPILHNRDDRPIQSIFFAMYLFIAYAC